MGLHSVQRADVERLQGPHLPKRHVVDFGGVEQVVGEDVSFDFLLQPEPVVLAGEHDRAVLRDLPAHLANPTVAVQRWVCRTLGSPIPDQCSVHVPYRGPARGLLGSEWGLYHLRKKRKEKKALTVRPLRGPTKPKGRAPLESGELDKVVRKGELKTRGVERILAVIGTGM
eukprot:1186743-Prorocentrum_minimum.AAC.2